MMVTVAMTQAQMHTHLHEASQQWTHNLRAGPATSRTSPPFLVKSASPAPPPLSWNSTPAIQFYLEYVLRQQQLLDSRRAAVKRTAWVPKSTTTTTTTSTTTTTAMLAPTSWARPRSGSGSLREWKRSKPTSPDGSPPPPAAIDEVRRDTERSTASVDSIGVILAPQDTDQRQRTRRPQNDRGNDAQSMRAAQRQLRSASAVVQHGEQLRMRGIQPSRRTNEIHIHIAPAMDTSVKHMIAQ